MLREEERCARFKEDTESFTVEDRDRAEWEILQQENAAVQEHASKVVEAEKNSTFCRKVRAISEREKGQCGSKPTLERLFGILYCVLQRGATKKRPWKAGKPPEK